MRWWTLGVLSAAVWGCGDGVFLIDARDASAVADGGLADAAGLDAGEPADGGSDAGPAPLHPERYPPGRTHSPVTPFVAENLRSVRSRGPELRDDVFAKVGDSITVSAAFMTCLADSPILDGRDSLQATIDHFRGGDAAGTTPFERVSAAAGVGWSTQQALQGTPSPLEQEVEAILPAQALVMFGTNDVGFVPLEDYAQNLLDLTDALLDRGVVPTLSTIPARLDDPTVDARVPRFNLAVRAIAQARQIPLIDLHLALQPLPNQGLGGDGVHLSTAGSSACDFRAEGLQGGMNVRNLASLEALDRARRAISEAAAPDAPGPALVGDGSPAAPFVIDTLPFLHVANTAFSEHRNLDVYSGCAASQDESGPEYLYRLELATARDLWIRVLDRGDVDVDVHLLSAPSEAGCLERAHRELEVSLAAGTYYLSLDTFVGAREQAGEYLLIVAER